MSIDLRNLSAKELGALIEKAKQQQNRLAKRTPIATVRSKITKFAKAEGYTLEELFGMSGNRGAKGAAKPSFSATIFWLSSPMPENRLRPSTGRPSALQWSSRKSSSSSTTTSRSTEAANSRSSRIGSGQTRPSFRI